MAATTTTSGRSNESKFENLDISNLEFLFQLEKSMKNRYKSNNNERSGDYLTNLVRAQTNELLRKGIVISLLQAIRNRLTGNFDRFECIKFAGIIKAQSYVIFFSLYQTQAEEEVKDTRNNYYRIHVSLSLLIGSNSAGVNYSIS